MLGEDPHYGEGGYLSQEGEDDCLGEQGVDRCVEDVPVVPPESTGAALHRETLTLALIVAPIQHQQPE